MKAKVKKQAKEMVDLDLYFDSYKRNQEESIISSIESLINCRFPDIQNLEVSMNQVKYDDERYSVDEVTEFVMSLFKPKP